MTIPSQEHVSLLRLGLGQAADVVHVDLAGEEQAVGRVHFGADEGDIVLAQRAALLPAVEVATTALARLDLQLAQGERLSKSSDTPCCSAYVRIWASISPTMRIVLPCLRLLPTGARILIGSSCPSRYPLNNPGRFSVQGKTKPADPSGCDRDAQGGQAAHRIVVVVIPQQALGIREHDFPAGIRNVRFIQLLSARRAG